MREQIGRLRCRFKARNRKHLLCSPTEHGLAGRAGQVGVLESLPEALAGVSVPISSFWRMAHSLPLRGFESCALSFSSAADVLDARKGISPGSNLGSEVWNL